MTDIKIKAAENIPCDTETTREKIKDHFAKITSEKLEENLKKAGIDIYTNREGNEIFHRD
jgi:hypothetical protein